MRGRVPWIAVSICLAPALVMGEEVIDRNVLTNETWTASSGPYIIQKDLVEIKNGSTLTIGPGVEVRLEPGTAIETVAGSSIVAVGAPGDSVRFTSNAVSPAAGDWESIHVYSSPASEFQHCVFTYGRYAMKLTDSDTQVTKCAFRECVFGGYLMDSGAAIDSSRFQGCGWGLWLVRSSPTITSCWITGSQNVGILSWFVESLPFIWHCNLFDNANYNIQLESYGDDVTVTARQNWWGSDVESVIGGTIRDAADGYGDGTVDYSDWLTDVPVEPASWGAIKALFRY